MRRSQRILPTLDYLVACRRPESVANVRTWFTGKCLNGEHNAAVAQRRAGLEDWPIISLYMLTPANVSMILEFSDL